MLRVAHRAGNELDRLPLALEAGADLVEADVHLHRGRLEVRHTKSLGPLPWLWDFWYLLPASTPRLYLAELAAAVRPEAQLMLDLKGLYPQLGPLVARVMEQAAPGMPYTVCTRTWRALDAFEHLPHVRRVHSVRTPTELRLLHRRLRTRSTWGVCLHRELLTPAVVAALHQRAEVVLTWPVNSPEALGEVRAKGVDGVISDDLAALEARLG